MPASTQDRTTVEKYNLLMESIKAQACELADKRKHPRLATQVEIDISEDMLPWQPNDEVVSFRDNVRQILNDYSIFLCDDDIEVEIIPVEFKDNTIELHATWNVLIPENFSKVLRILLDSARRHTENLNQRLATIENKLPR